MADRDLELGNEVVGAKDEKPSQPNQNDQRIAMNEDAHQVDWDGPDDQENPFNWPTWKKMRQLVLMAFNTFIT